MNLKKCESIGLFSSSNVQVTNVRVSISVFKGRPKKTNQAKLGTFVFP